MTQNLDSVSIVFSVFSTLVCHLLVTFLIIDKVGGSEVAKYVACDVFFEKILSGQDSNFSLSTLDVLQYAFYLFIYRLKYNLVRSFRRR